MPRICLQRRSSALKLFGLTYADYLHPFIDMLRIRLQRTGNKNNPTYRLVVTEKSNAAKGKSMEFLGHYLPTRDPAVFEFNAERVDHWIKNGAQPTDTVARLLSNNGVKGLEKYMERYSKKKKRNAPEEEEAPAEAPAPAAEEKPEEAPAEEAPEQEPKEEAAEPEVPTEEAKEEETPAEEPAAEDAPAEEAPAEEAKEEESSESEDDKKEEDA